MVPDCRFIISLRTNSPAVAVGTYSGRGGLLFDGRLAPPAPPADVLLLLSLPLVAPLPDVVVAAEAAEAAGWPLGPDTEAEEDLPAPARAEVPLVVPSRWCPPGVTTRYVNWTSEGGSLSGSIFVNTTMSPLWSVFVLWVCVIKMERDEG